ncbi:uncharacterized protein LOC143078133 [Mytilus galloprovincialis]|uniref:uncharacterized protein LOC143078133 n=1 Tax=Mytilus galloprovincialis TaxID=29158 RepID=UPI003F7C0E42
MVAINAGIAFLLNDETKASCGPPLGGKPGGCNPMGFDVVQNISESITSWSKSSVDVSDDGLWTCEVGGKSSENETLLIYEFPNDTLAEIGITSNIVVNETSLYPVEIDIACLFSKTSPSINLQFVAEGIVHWSEPMACMSLPNDCFPCEGCSPYGCNHTISFKQALSSNQNKYILQIEVGVTGNSSKFTQRVFSPYTVRFESTGRSSESSKNISAGEIAGIAVGVVAIVGIIGVVTSFVIKHMQGKGKKDVKS